MKIAIFRALYLGDMMCIVPAIRSLRSAYKNAEVTLIGLPWSIEFVQLFLKYVDKHISFPGYHNLPESKYAYQQFEQCIANIKKEMFDLVIQMHGDGTITNYLVSLFGAKHTAGSYKHGSECPDEQRYVEYDEELPEIYRNLFILKKLGIPSLGDALEFPLDKNNRNELPLFPSDPLLKRGSFICIHAGARDPKRRWNPKNFAWLADSFMSLGYQVVLTGSKDEEFIAKKIIFRMKCKPVNMVGKFSIKETALLISRAKLVVTNCTSISHIADALQIPSVIIFLSSSINRWAPLDRVLHRVVSKEHARSPFYALAQARELLENKQQTNYLSSLTK